MKEGRGGRSITVIPCRTTKNPSAASHPSPRHRTAQTLVHTSILKKKKRDITDPSFSRNLLQSLKVGVEPTHSTQSHRGKKGKKKRKKAISLRQQKQRSSLQAICHASPADRAAQPRGGSGPCMYYVPTTREAMHISSSGVPRTDQAAATKNKDVHARVSLKCGSSSHLHNQPTGLGSCNPRCRRNA